MTAVAPQSVVPRSFPAVKRSRGSRFLGYLSTTDPKVLGVMYIVTSFVFFMVGGLLALLRRAELARPGLQLLSPEQYNQLFTMRGTIMLLFYATPVVFGFANYMLPLQIGAPDVASPAIDFHVADSYFVVAHFHYVLFGTIVFATYSGICFWCPKNRPQMLDRLRAEANPRRGREPLQDSESSPHVAIGTTSTDPNDDQGT